MPARRSRLSASTPPRAKQVREAAFRKLAAQGFDTDVAASAARLWYEETLAAAE